MWLVVRLYSPYGLKHHVSFILFEDTLPENVIQMQATLSHLLQTPTDIHWSNRKVSTFYKHWSNFLSFIIALWPKTSGYYIGYVDNTVLLMLQSDVTQVD